MSPREPRLRRDDHPPKSVPPTRAKPPHTSEGRRAGLPAGVRIVHEDADLLVVDKPTGLVTATPPPERGPGSRPPHPGASARTLFDALKRRFSATAPVFRKGAARNSRRGRNRGDDGEDRRDPQTPGLWIIHRLDKEASGLLVFAKSLRAFNWLKEDLRARRIHRVYMAVTEGIRGPAGTTATHQSMIADDRSARTRPSHPRGRGTKPHSAVEGADSQLAITHFRVIASGHDRSLVQVRLDTGRKNQIRIHMAELGSPLIGDQRFGAKTDPIKRLALHAAELTFKHPATGQPVTFLSPAPETFYTCVGAVAPKAVVTASPTEARPPDAGHRSPTAPADTSWNKVAVWYDELLEDRGNDLYEQVILPGTLKLIEPRAGLHILDLACGQGILSRRLAGLGVHVCGVDSAPDLINTAKARGSPGPAIAYSVADARKLDTKALREHAPKGYDAITCVMALSNIDSLEPVAAAVSALLRPSGAFIAVVTHPAFRAIGQTSWEWDPKSQRQFRRVDGYLSPGQAPIEMHPGKAARGRAATTTWTFHRPIQTYVAALVNAGLLIDRLEEWPSMRASQPGPRAAEENRIRREIPMFLGIRAVKR